MSQPSARSVERAVATKRSHRKPIWLTLSIRETFAQRYVQRGCAHRAAATRKMLAERLVCGSDSCVPVDASRVNDYHNVVIPFKANRLVVIIIVTAWTQRRIVAQASEVNSFSRRTRGSGSKFRGGKCS